MSIWSPDYLLHNARDPVMRGDDTWHFLSLREMFPQCLWGETDREVNTEEPEVGAISVSSVMHTRTHRDEWTEVSVVLVWLKPQGDRTGCVEQSMTSASLPSPPAESHRLQGFRDTYPVSANICLTWRNRTESIMWLVSWWRSTTWEWQEIRW